MRSRKEHLGLQLITVSRRYRRVMDGALSDYDLTDATTLPLRYLVRLDQGIRQKDLADILDIEGPTLVRVLDQLVTMGLVERVECPQDRRAKLVSATQKGRDLHRSFEAKLKVLRDEIFQGVSDADIETAITLLTQLERSLQRASAGEEER